MKQDLYLAHEDALFWADFSYVDFPDDYLGSMQPAIESALQAMGELEGGAIANPDENRMVGHYWLRVSWARSDFHAPGRKAEFRIRPYLPSFTGYPRCFPGGGEGGVRLRGGPHRKFDGRSGEPIS